MLRNVGVSCTDGCAAVGLECTEAAQLLHNGDVDSSAELMSVIAALGGSPAGNSAGECGGIYGTSDAVHQTYNKPTAGRLGYAQGLQALDSGLSSRTKLHIHFAERVPPIEEHRALVGSAVDHERPPVFRHAQSSPHALCAQTER